MGANFARMCLIPEFGSTCNLARIVDMGKACELVFTARIVDAQEAKEIGLVNKVVSDEELKKATYEMATTIAKLPPTAIQLARRGLYQGPDGDLPTQLQFGAFGLEACVRSADFAEAVSAFIKKRSQSSGDKKSKPAIQAIAKKPPISRRLFLKNNLTAWHSVATILVEV